MILRIVLPITTAAFLLGCSTTVDKVTKSPELTAAVPAATVVFVGSMAEGGGARQSLGMALFTPGAFPLSAPGLNEDAKALGQFTLSSLPDAVRQAGVQFSYSTHLLSTRPASRAELDKAIGAGGAGKPVLIVQPVSARMECPSSCFVFTLDAQLLASGNSATPLWTATMTAPPRASKFHDFSSPGKSVAEALVKQLKSDAVLR